MVMEGDQTLDAEHAVSVQMLCYKVVYLKCM